MGWEKSDLRAEVEDAEKKAAARMLAEARAYTGECTHDPPCAGSIACYGRTYGIDLAEFYTGKVRKDREAERAAHELRIDPELAARSRIGERRSRRADSDPVRGDESRVRRAAQWATGAEPREKRRRSPNMTPVRAYRLLIWLRVLRCDLFAEGGAIDQYAIVAGLTREAASDQYKRAREIMLADAALAPVWLAELQDTFPPLPVGRPRKVGIGPVRGWRRDRTPAADPSTSPSVMAR